MLRGCQLLMRMGKALVPVCKAQECTGAERGGRFWGATFSLFQEEKSVGGHDSPRGDSKDYSLILNLPLITSGLAK